MRGRLKLSDRWKWRSVKGGSGSGGGGGGGGGGGSSKSGGGAPQTQTEFNDAAAKYAEDGDGIFTFDQALNMGIPPSKVADMLRNALDDPRFSPVRGPGYLQPRGITYRDFSNYLDKAEALGLGSKVGDNPLVGVRLLGSDGQRNGLPFFNRETAIGSPATESPKAKPSLSPSGRRFPNLGKRNK